KQATPKYSTATTYPAVFVPIVTMLLTLTTTRHFVRIRQEDIPISDSQKGGEYCKFHQRRKSLSAEHFILKAKLFDKLSVRRVTVAKLSGESSPKGSLRVHPFPLHRFDLLPSLDHFKHVWTHC